MMKDLLNVEGPVFSFLDKLGQLIVLSALWLLGCIPVVTICTSNAALYYAVVKSVRRGQGNAVREFLKSYRENLGRGIPVTIAVGVLCSVLTLNLQILQGQGRPLLSAGALVGTVLTVLCFLYAGPVLSRFRMKTLDVIKLTFVMSLRFAPVTLLILFGAAVAAAAQFYLLPMPAVLILPGVGCYLVTFPVEKVLRPYMPGKEENSNAWYYET